LPEPAAPPLPEPNEELIEETTDETTEDEDARLDHIEDDEEVS